MAEFASAVLTVDLSAIVANWMLLRSRHGSGVTGAVIKGSGYGLGATEVAAALYGAGCRHFFVATADEALAARAIIPGAALVVLGGLGPGTEREFAAHEIIPALGSLAEIESWTRHARGLGRALPAYVHFDTGMSRLGLDRGEYAALAEDHSLLDGIDLQCVMSHLVSAEIPDDPMNVLQLDRFYSGLRGLPKAAASLVNSSGMFLEDGFGFDLARPGAALYGVNPVPGRPNPMRPVVSLTAVVQSVRDIRSGDTVGYNGTWVATRPSRVATVGVGYADGWHRGHSNRGQGYFDGHPIPLVGRVSMDLTTYDVTDQPGVIPGSIIELLGTHRTVDAAARDAGTIGYEVLTALGSRFRRVYKTA